MTPSRTQPPSGRTRHASPPLRRYIRVTAEALMTGTGLTHLMRRRVGDRIAVLAYHNVVLPQDAGRGDASLHLPLPEFIRQVERVCRTHDIVDLETAAEFEPARRPRAVITFDDAYRGAVTLALPELTRRGIPAVVFVAPGLLGTRITWWDALAEAGRLSEPQRDAMLHDLGGRTDRVMQAIFAGAALPDVPDSYAIASEEELLAAAAPGIRFGSHTWAHEYLPALSNAEVSGTLARASDWLSRFGASRSDWLALPYGGGSVETGRMALACGHAGVLAIDGGLWQPRDHRGLVPRINVPAGMSWRGLELRTSGLLPS